MSQILLGWPNGTLGIIFGALAGLAVMYVLWRQSPWDIHDEHSYAEAPHLTVKVVLPDVVSFFALVALTLGMGALDHAIQPLVGIAGDVIGLLAMLGGLYYALTGPHVPPKHDRWAGLAAPHPASRTQESELPR